MNAECYDPRRKGAGTYERWEEHPSRRPKSPELLGELASGSRRAWTMYSPVSPKNSLRDIF